MDLQTLRRRTQPSVQNHGKLLVSRVQQKKEVPDMAKVIRVTKVTVRRAVSDPGCLVFHALYRGISFGLFLHHLQTIGCVHPDFRVNDQQ